MKNLEKKLIKNITNAEGQRAEYNNKIAQNLISLARVKDFNLDNILNAYVNFLKSTEEKDIASHVSSFFDGASIFPFNYSVAQFIKFASEDKKNVQKYTDALVDIFDIYSNDNFYYNSFKPDRTDWACNTAKHIIEYIKSVEGANKIIWFLDGIKIKTKYNVIGEFVTTLKVENLYGKEIYFILLGDNGQTKSKAFGFLPQEVL